jgi:radical SAM superfamily enzyme YgiQ (UPF0313 family)
MKIALISPYEDITNLGARSLSAYVKQAGHQSRLLFVPISTNDGSGYSYLYKPKTIEKILELIEDVEVVGMSVMTHHFDAIAQLTGEIHSKLGKKVIWGGIHPTARTEESLHHADIVCRGEGEEAFLELIERMANGTPLEGIQNLWFRSNGNLHQNPARPLIQDLDSLPFFDYSCQDHHYIDNSSSSTVSLTHQNIKNYLQNFDGITVYRTTTSRGCPHNCAYCCHSSLRKMYSNQRYVRFRSSENIIQELLHIREKMEFISFVVFMDEVFLLNSVEKNEEFCRLYKEKIDLPFRIQISPSSLKEDKLKLLVDSGCIVVGMGIETGSRKTQDLYKRKFGNNKNIVQSANIIQKFHEKIRFIIYDIIVDNPYESPEDVAETFRLLMKLPRPYQINLFSLTLFPGTDLYQKARTEGLVGEDHQEIYQKMISSVSRNYVNTILKLVNLQATPTFLLKPLGHPWMVSIMSRAPYKFVILLERTYLLIEKILFFFFIRGKTIKIHGMKSNPTK